MNVINTQNILSKYVKPMETIDLRVVHILIGCKTHHDGRPGPKPIHEFPKLARLLLVDPMSIFDNTMLSYSYHRSVLSIHQVLYLIDPLYENTQALFARDGIKELSTNGTNIIALPGCVIMSSIEMVVCPIKTTTKEITTLVEVLKSYPNTLINIQDTTGSSMCTSVFQSDHQVHIVNSDCFLDTSAKYLCPAIAYLRWVNMKQDILKMFSDTYTGDEYMVSYLKEITNHIFFKKELVALSSIWSLIESNEEIHHITTGKTRLSDITVQTYCANYKLLIRPYIEYRRMGNVVLDQIIKFLDWWNDHFSYASPTDTRTFLDIVKQECRDRFEILGIRESCLTHRDLVNIIERNANKA